MICKLKTMRRICNQFPKYCPQNYSDTVLKTEQSVGSRDFPAGTGVKLKTTQSDAQIQAEATRYHQAYRFVYNNHHSPNKENRKNSTFTGNDHTSKKNVTM